MNGGDALAALTSEFSHPTHASGDKAVWNTDAGTVTLEDGCIAVGCEYKALLLYVDANTARIVPLPIDEVVRRAKLFLGRMT